jgi:hypothetical protein
MALLSFSRGGWQIHLPEGTGEVRWDRDERRGKLKSDTTDKAGYSAQMLVRIIVKLIFS